MVCALWWIGNATAPPPGPDGGVTTSAPAWPRPRFGARQDERHRMVRQQIVPEGVRDPRVLTAMRNVPRHAFVPARYRMRAYADTPLPIGHDQTISQPLMVAAMTETLALRPGHKVLEIGTGCGYQAAVLAELTPHVFTIEIVEPLAREAAARLTRLGYKTVQCKSGDGFGGWPEHAPFDAIVVTCAAPQIPAPLLDQLAVGGRLVIPVGEPDKVQRLMLVTKTETGEVRKALMPVRFVPMTRRTDRQPD